MSQQGLICDLPFTPVERVGEVSCQIFSETKNLDAGHQKDTGHWTPDTGHRTLDTGRRTKPCIGAHATHCPKSVKPVPFEAGNHNISIQNET